MAKKTFNERKIERNDNKLCTFLCSTKDHQKHDYLHSSSSKEDSIVLVRKGEDFIAYSYDISEKIN